MNPRKWAEKEGVDARSFSKKGAATGPLIGERRRVRARPLERARRSLLRNLVEESERSSSSFVHTTSPLLEVVGLVGLLPAHTACLPAAELQAEKNRRSDEGRERHATPTFWPRWPRRKEAL